MIPKSEKHSVSIWNLQLFWNILLFNYFYEIRIKQYFCECEFDNKVFENIKFATHFNEFAHSSTLSEKPSNDFRFRSLLLHCVCIAFLMVIFAMLLRVLLIFSYSDVHIFKCSIKNLCCKKPENHSIHSRSTMNDALSFESIFRSKTLKYSIRIHSNRYIDWLRGTQFAVTCSANTKINLRRTKEIRKWGTNWYTILSNNSMLINNESSNLRRLWEK